MIRCPSPVPPLVRRIHRGGASGHLRPDFDETRRAVRRERAAVRVIFYPPASHLSIKGPSLLRPTCDARDRCGPLATPLARGLFAAGGKSSIRPSWQNPPDPSASPSSAAGNRAGQPSARLRPLPGHARRRLVRQQPRGAGQAASRQTGITATYADYHELLQARRRARGGRRHAQLPARPDRAGGGGGGEARACAKSRSPWICPRRCRWPCAAEGAGVRHMTAFTYRFVPAMRYMAHLVHRGDIGRPYHFRAQRFQDWGDPQPRLAAGEEAGRQRRAGRHAQPPDRLRPPAHRPRRAGSSPTRAGSSTPAAASPRTWTTGWPSSPSSTATAAHRTTGVLESTKLATGRGEGHHGQDVCEVNGEAGTLVFTTQKPLELHIGKPGRGRPGNRPRPHRIPRLARLPARPGRRPAGDLPLRPGFRVHRRHPQRPPLPAVVARRRAGAGGDGRGPSVRRAAEVGGRCGRRGNWRLCSRARPLPNPMPAENQGGGGWSDAAIKTPGTR